MRNPGAGTHDEGSRLSWNALPETERTELNHRLTNRQHACYTLWLAGLGYSKISEALGISRSTAVMHVKRARAIHRTILEAT